MPNPFPSGEGETRDLDDAQMTTTTIYDRVGAARRNNARRPKGVISQGHQDGETDTMGEMP